MTVPTEGLVLAAIAAAYYDIATYDIAERCGCTARDLAPILHALVTQGKVVYEYDWRTGNCMYHSAGKKKEEPNRYGWAD